MKWFKHENTFNNPKIESLCHRHGIAGYGFYFSILELISSNIEDNNQEEWGYIPKEYNDEYLAKKLHLNDKEFKELLQSCYELNLFVVKNDRIHCAQILERCDDYIARIRRSSKSKRKYKQSTKLVRTKSEVSTTLEEEREEEEEQDKKKILKEKLTQFLNTWNESYKTKYSNVDAISSNYEYWLTHYEQDQILKAVQKSRFDQYWRDKLRPDMLLRKMSPQREAVDRIADFLNSRVKQDLFVQEYGKIWPEPSDETERQVWLTKRKDYLTHLNS